MTRGRRALAPHPSPLRAMDGTCWRHAGASEPPLSASSWPLSQPPEPFPHPPSHSLACLAAPVTSQVARPVEQS